MAIAVDMHEGYDAAEVILPSIIYPGALCIGQQLPDSGIDGQRTSEYVPHADRDETRCIRYVKIIWAGNV